MALETLKHVMTVNNYPIIHIEQLKKSHADKFDETGAIDHQWFKDLIRPYYYIYVRQDKNSLTFTLQNGPVKEHGVNGCQVDEIIATARLILMGLDEKFPCEENGNAIHHLQHALDCLQKRRADREARGVEGQSQP